MKKWFYMILAALTIFAVTKIALFNLGLDSEPSADISRMSAAEPMVLAYSVSTYEEPATYLYDREGRLIIKTQEGWDQETKYTYRSTGSLQTETVYQNGEATAITEYDAKGNPSAEYVKEPGTMYGLTLWREYTNRYDDRGRMVECSWRDKDGMGETTLYTYFDDGSYQEEFLDYYFEGDVQYPHCHNLKNYDPDGELYMVSSDLEDMSEVSTDWSRSRDERGNPIEDISVGSYEGRYWFTTYQYANSYDASGRLSRTEKYRSTYEQEGKHIEETPMTHIQTVDYTYDYEGRLIRTRTTYPDSDYVEESVWEYDAWGNLVYFKGIRDGEEDQTEETYLYLPLSEVLYLE